MQQRMIWILAYCYVFFLKRKERLSKALIWTAARIYVYLIQTGYRPLLYKTAAILISLSILVLPVVPLLTIPTTTVAASATAADPSAWILDQKYIAHGMGEVDGISTTNTREALISSYKAGYRVLEADLIMTTDGVLALRHDNWRFITLDDGSSSKTYDPMSLADFRDAKPGDDLTPITFEELALIMKVYPEIRIITDTKESDLDAVLAQLDQIEEIVDRVDPALFHRITPQFYSEEMYQRMKGRYSFSDYIYTLYMSEATPEEVVSFMKREGLSIVTLDKERATSDFISRLDQNGIFACVHTVNEQAEMNSLASLGVESFYTDNLLRQ